MWNINREWWQVLPPGSRVCDYCGSENCSSQYWGTADDHPWSSLRSAQTTWRYNRAVHTFWYAHVIVTTLLQKAIPYSFTLASTILNTMSSKLRRNNLKSFFHCWLCFLTASTEKDNKLEVDAKLVRECLCQGVDCLSCGFTMFTQASLLAW